MKKNNSDIKDDIKGGGKDMIQGIVWLLVPIALIYILYLLAS